ncbi:MAG: helix-turn-helix transcriptional regulator [Bacillota bacterium]|nr:helix-turn-helix transcriptional regulator [Bacillota bacterium]
MNSKEIGSRLIKLRGDRSQQEVVKAVNISPSALSMYENGERIPRDEVKERLAAYYNTSVQALFYAD